MGLVLFLCRQPNEKNSKYVNLSFYILNTHTNGIYTDSKNDDGDTNYLFYYSLYTYYIGHMYISCKDL